jgi:DNA-binding XRE family transcriptional regulator
MDISVFERTNQGKVYRQEISMCYCPLMPASVRRHNLARLRQELSLTQAALGGMIGRSQATIKAIETGKLALSEDLATLISVLLGTDKQWLLDNDLSAPVPPSKYFSATISPEEKAYTTTIYLLSDLFKRLFAFARRLRKTNARETLQLEITEELETLKKSEGDPKAEPRGRATVTTFEFFKNHPEQLDLDLARLINLDFLLRDCYARERAIKARRRELGLELDQNQTEKTAAKRWSKKRGFSAGHAKSSARASSPSRRKAPSRSRPSA